MNIFKLILKCGIILFLIFSEKSLCFSSSFIKSNDSISYTIQDDSSKYFNNLGIELIFDGNFNKGEDYLKKSLKIYKTNSKDIWNIATAHINLGIAYLEYWKFEEAIANFDYAFRIFSSNPDSFALELGITLGNKGIVYLKTGEYQKSINTIETAINYMLKVNKSNELNIWLSTSYNILSTVYLNQKKFNESLYYFNKTLQLAKKDNPALVPPVYNNIALAYEEMNDFENAELNYNKAVKGYIKLDLNYNLADLYLNFANFYLKTGNKAKAYTYLNNAKNVAIEFYGNKSPVLSEIYRLMGNYYEKSYNYDSALYYYQYSMISLFEQYNELSVYSNPFNLESFSDIYLLKTLKDKAAALHKYYHISENISNLEYSLKTYELAVKLIEKLRLSYQDMDSKLYLSENESKTYSDAIHTACELWNATLNEQYKYEAFKYAEKSKSAVLLSSVRDAEAKGFGGIPDSLLKKEKEIIRDLAFYKEQVYEEKRKEKPDLEKLELWGNILYKLNNENDLLIKNFEKRYPQYYNLKYDTRVIDIAGIQQKMEKNVSILEYVLSDSVLYTFLIQKNSFVTFQQNIDSVFYRSVDDLLASIHLVDILRHNYSDFEKFSQSSSTLYDILFSNIKDKIENERIIIIPDGILSLLPFEVLINLDINDKGKMNYKDFHYLIKDYAISYAYSSTMLYEQKIKKNTKTDKRLLAFAPGYEGLDTVAFRGNSRNGYRKSLSPIPGAKDEVERIIKLVRGRLFEDNDATETLFKLYAENYAILHLAMHGIIDNQNPMFSKLVFTASKDTLNDGFLNTFEIYNMKLNARMAVLSSCGSGEGMLKKGEGIMSLARGFSYAGCPSLIMTLWEIEDKSSADLMVSFYRYLKKGYSKDIALQKAKLDFIQSNSRIFAHPFFWSSYQCIGDSSVLFHRNKLFISGGALVMLIIIILYLKFKWLKKKNKY